MPRRTSTPIALAIASCVFALLQAALGTAAAVEAVAFVAPLLLIVVPLLCGRFVGERAIHRAAGRRRAPARLRRPVPVLPSSYAPRALVARGGRLIAASLAVRPPPAPVV